MYNSQISRLFCLCLLLICALNISAQAQGYEKEINATEKPRVRIVNRAGRVSVVAANEQQSSVLVKAASVGQPVSEKEISANASSGIVEIAVTPRKTNSESERIDLSVRVPARSRVEVVTDAGSVDLIGNLEEAVANTNTGTIRADVPLEALSFKFFWSASRPRYFSEKELPPVKEKAAGKFEIAGRFGEKDAKPEERVKLNLTTERGVVLLGVDPAMVPTDLRERKLTEAARAIIASGDEDLTDAIRKVSPHLFRDYVRELPAHQGYAPTLVKRTPPTSATLSSNSAQLVRLNVNVTDRLGRAISGLTARNFKVIENNEPKEVAQVEASNAPFNLVLLLDVSGSVEERLDYIRKAARSFVRTVGPQDRVAVISFRDDVQLIADFTTDRSKLISAIDQIQAGGATTLYDSLAYVLLHTLKPLRGERCAVVVLSDGDDNRSFVPFPALLEATIESGAIIYPLYVPSGLIPVDSAPNALAAIDPMRSKFLTLTSRAEREGRQLAENSGGFFYPITRIEDLQKAYDDIISQLRTSYTLTYASGKSETRERRVRVRVDRENASVRMSPAVELALPTSNQQ